MTTFISIYLIIGVMIMWYNALTNIDDLASIINERINSPLKGLVYVFFFLEVLFGALIAPIRLMCTLCAIFRN